MSVLVVGISHKSAPVEVLERLALDADGTTKLLADVMGPDDPFPGDKVGQPVVLEGTWVPDGTVFVSGRERDGADGYWAVTPLAIGDAGAAGRVRVAEPRDRRVADLDRAPHRHGRAPVRAEARGDGAQRR